MGNKWLILVLVTLWMGCVSDQTAGTEVGNPTVYARFSIAGNADSMGVEEMNMNCMGLAYYTQPDTKHLLWATANGKMVNLADSTGSNGLIPREIDKAVWTKAEMVLRFPTGDSSLPDTVSFQDFSNPRYIKLQRKIGIDTARFLFEWPQNTELKLMFTKDRIASWNRNDSINLEIVFDGAKWMSEIPADLPSQSRRDGAGGRFILLNPKENTIGYNRLKAALPLCFRADSTEMH